VRDRRTGVKIPSQVAADLKELKPQKLEETPQTFYRWPLGDAGITPLNGSKRSKKNHHTPEQLVGKIAKAGKVSLSPMTLNMIDPNTEYPSQRAPCKASLNSSTKHVP